MPNLRQRLPNLPSLLPYLRRMRLSRVGLLLAVALLVCGSLASFALGQMLAHTSAAAALPQEDQRVSLTSTAGVPSASGAVGNGNSTGSTTGSSTGTSNTTSTGTSAGTNTGTNTSGSGSTGATSGSPASSSSTSRSTGNTSTSAQSSKPAAPSSSTHPSPGGQAPSTGSAHPQPQPQGNGKPQSGKPGHQGDHGHQGHSGQGAASGGQQGGQGDDSQGGDPQGNGSSASVTQSGNGQTITVSSGGSSVVVSSNGSGTSVSVSTGNTSGTTSGGASQGQPVSGSSVTTSSSGSCGAAQLRDSWPAIAEPLRTDQALIVRDGSALRVRFQVQGACAGKGAVPAHLYLAPMNGEFIPALSADGNGRSNAFRFDAGSSEYVYDLTTRGLSPGMYQLGIDLGNGQLFVVPFTLR